MNDEDKKRLEYCKRYNIHHLFELLATKVLVDRPDNPFKYLQNLLGSVEESERKKGTYDPTKNHFHDDHIPLIDGDLNTMGKRNSIKENATSKKITLGVFGLDNAGKTTILSAIGGEINKDCTPTIGFNPVHFQTDSCDVSMFDLGGAANFRGIWVHYFQDCHGIIYVIDSAAEDVTLMKSLEVLQRTLMHSYLQGKPVLLLANKKDLPTSRSEAAVAEEFLQEVLLSETPYRVVATCGIEKDETLEKGIEWLLTTVLDTYDKLENRVKKDTAAVKEAKNRERAKLLSHPETKSG
ncbi:unnamed protein product [Phytomonas sp. Hart1]|nr:unnamed protein product [Phytomonas sp. Hart1]|eukprot:CCW67060.1 unnamed protein product [Phytomonas sp. isolate Hart1]